MEKQIITTYEAAVQYLLDVPRFTKKNTVQDTMAYLHKLGDPDLGMKIIHVAGTNGKGSVCAYMRSILEAAGYRIAVFTSPHLVDIRERFVIAGEMISKEAFLNAFLLIYNSLDGDYHPTFFEFLFFIAMLVFPKANVDYCILETGLGGRLDATNSVAEKELSVITRISLDHVEYLGDTVEKIAGEKAGIIHKGAPVVYADVEPDATKVFEKRAKELGVRTYPVSKNDYAFLKFNNKNIDFSVHTGYYGYISLTLHTIARYQMENASLAVRAIEVLDTGRTITKEAVQKGIALCFWEGRMEEILPDVYVDGAHNEDGIRAFLETVCADGCSFGRTLLFSVVSDKDYVHMVAELVESGLFQHVAIAHMHTGRAATLENLRKLFDGYPDCKYTLYDNVATAFHTLLETQKQGERIYIAGSLYLVGEIKELLKHD